ncbi:GNAT family N-acetyltransferase [Paenibacillus peoriae]|uniref:GNAT family N-acetyltransferase n=1 Tax=Paenibacillus peoriae TaxID=59893 RepID=UPI00026C61EB|nr:GNAT family N-acetyltransferase [Paenibacillus peoriae]MEC0182814.1 GNAT family N-acetyltransferase [Paenibacillus peoriae]
MNNSTKSIGWYENQIREDGCYCMRSMQKAPGYVQKLNWTENEFSQGLTYIQIRKDNKPAGFIEYARGEQAWRAVHADGYLVIHCLWMGITGLGLGSQLIQRCIEDAVRLGKKGVAVITNTDTSWAPGPDIFLKNGFQHVEDGPYSFQLYVYKLNSDHSDPYFPNNWTQRLERFSEGLTILRTHQCPYLEIAAQNVIEAAESVGIQPEIMYIHDRPQLMELSPTPYGVFHVIYKGELISYHRLTPRSFAKKLSMLYDKS